MKKTLLFHASVIRSTTSKASPELFDSSIEAYEDRNYTASLHYLLDAIDPEIRKNQSLQKTGEYTIPHGPLLIEIKQKEDQLFISAPFVSLSKTEPLPMLRQVTSLNFNELDMARLTLKEKGLYFKYHCPLIYSHPQKIRRVLEEICRSGAKHDYEFIDQFQVERIVKPCFKPYTTEEVQYVYQTIQASCQESLEAIRYFESIRQFDDMWLLLRTTFLKLLYVCHPQGKLLHLLQQAIEDIDRDLPTAELVAEGKTVLKQLQEKSQEEITEYLYTVQTFIPAKQRSNLQKLRENYETCYKQVSALMEGGNFRKACLKIIHKIYETYYLNLMDEDLDTLFVKVLEETSAQPWAIAAPVLYQLFDDIMQGRIRKNIPPIAA